VQLEVALSLPREARSVPVARHILRAGLRSIGAEEGCTHDVEVALSEACTNVLQHGDPAAEYQVRVRLDGERCLLRVVEVVGDLADGAGWEPAGSKLPDGLAERGRRAGRPGAQPVAAAAVVGGRGVVSGTAASGSGDARSPPCPPWPARAALVVGRRPPTSAGRALAPSGTLGTIVAWQCRRPAVKLPSATCSSPVGDPAERRPGATGARAACPLVEGVEGRRGDDDRVRLGQHVRLAGQLVVVADRVAGAPGKAGHVDPLKGAWGGGQADLPAVLLRQVDQHPHVHGGRRGAGHDVEHLLA
jgi:serine/threonine-protein kinase RsbW